MQPRLRLAVLLAGLGGGCALVAGLDDDAFVLPPGGTAPLTEGGSGTSSFTFDVSAGEVWRSDQPLTVHVHLTRHGVPGKVDVTLVQPPDGIGSAGLVLDGIDDGALVVTSQGKRPQGPLTLSFSATAASDGGAPQMKSITLDVAGSPGELDTSFAGTGYVVLPGVGSLHAVTTLEDGSIVALGDDVTKGRRDGFAARLLPSGSSDDGFRFPAPLLPEGDAGEQSAIRSAIPFGERIVFGGTTIRAADARYGAVLGALFKDGGLDPTFGDHAGFSVIVRVADDDGGVRTIEEVTDFVDAGPREAGLPRFATLGDSDGTGVIRVFDERGARAEPLNATYAGTLFALRQVDPNRFLAAGTSAFGTMTAGVCPVAAPCTAISLPGAIGYLFGIVPSAEGFVAIGSLLATGDVAGAVVTRFDRDLQFVDTTTLKPMLAARKAAVLDDGRIAVAGASAKGLAYAILPKDGAATGVTTAVELPLTELRPARPRGAWEAVAPYRGGRIVVVGETSDTTAITDYLGTRVVARYWN